ncbi:MAG: hypothetical protein H7175_21940, partial [Burkholderiales bacterium]|nr:hypothetical protein [Anaerolineae bacterium]
GLTASAMDGTLHVTGGEIFNIGLPDTFNQHDAFDVETGEWMTLPYMPTARHGLASAAVNGRWYVIGGGLEAAAQTYVTLSNLVEVYTPE